MPALNPRQFPADCIGLVSPQTLHFDAPLQLDCGRSLPGYDLVFETYGQLNAQRDNAILICHALSGNHHAAGYHEAARKPGWWNTAIGPGKPFDTNRFFIVSPSNLGGYQGSTGPASENPETGRSYGADFPVVTVRDWVRAQAALADRLGIAQWAAVAGGSLGGMQALQWSIDYPSRLRHALVIATAPKLSAQNIAFNEIARQAIFSDPDFHQGNYEAHATAPRLGLALARMLGHITYLSDSAMRAKFGRDLKVEKLAYGYGVEFEVESYLRYQGQAFVDRFDANTYLLMTKALDYFDPAREYGGNLTGAMQQAQAEFLVVSFTSDWRFAPERSREIVKALVDADKRVSYAEVETELGHDDFLLSNPTYMQCLRGYLSRVADAVSP